MYNIEYFINLLANSGKKVTVSCAAPYDAATIEAIEVFRKEGLLEAILVGEKTKIANAIAEANADETNYEIIEEEDLKEIAKKTVTAVSSQKANFVMKAMIDTSIILKEFLQKEHGLRREHLLSHVGLFYKKDSNRLFLLTDAGMNIAPNLDEKKMIIENAVSIAHSLNINNPNVAMLCAKEKAYDKMPATMDAKKLQEMNVAGEISGCLVSGPLQLDNAVSRVAAEAKGITDPVAGNADIFVVPNIETGNVFGKALIYLADDYQTGGIVVGSKVPVVLTSRADGVEEKIISLALAMAKMQKEVA